MIQTLLQNLWEAVRPFIRHAIAYALFSLWEYWLGKTEKTKANSTWELAGYLVKSTIQKLIKEKEEK